MGTLQVLDRIIRIAEHAPDRPALRAADGRSVGYRELVAAATRISEHLRRAHGVGPEDVVAAVLPRDPNAIIALLGIWMSGAAYLPVDTEWPQRRRAFVLGESATHLVEEAGEGHADVVMPGRTGLRFQQLNSSSNRRQGRGHGGGSADAQNLAYILYTSGSTGTPNAVGVDFGALDNYGDYLRNLVQQPALHTDDAMKVLLSAPPTFDASLRPVLLLAAGATLVIAPDLRDGSWQDQIDCINDHAVTVLSAVPSWYSGLLGAGYRPSQSGLRLAFLGGEPLPNGVVRELTADGCTVVVQYGPTETTIAATGTILTGDDFTEPPIGAPIPGAAVHLYQDDTLAEPAAGEPGHLYVSGAGVARGYLHNPRLTAERFVPNPAGPPGSRMFRTGDLASRLPPDGYSFHGRLDDQVKIGGQRIEPGEVAAVLNQHPAVAHSVAFVQRKATHPRLIACYAGRGGEDEPGAAKNIRDHLVAELPGYLVPAMIHRVEHLPVTEHGKVDLAALEEYIGVGEAETATDDAVLDDVDKRLIEVVRRTLDTPCTLDDNFFALGGGSLDALEVLAHIREEFGVRVRLRNFFRAETIRELREMIGNVA